MDNIPSAYAEEAVAWAVENGLLQGGEAGNLMLSQPVTRQQLAAVLYRFAKPVSYTHLVCPHAHSLARFSACVPK